MDFDLTPAKVALHRKAEYGGAVVISYALLLGIVSYALMEVRKGQGRVCYDYFTPISNARNLPFPIWLLQPSQ